MKKFIIVLFFVCSIGILFVLVNYNGLNRNIKKPVVPKLKVEDTISEFSDNIKTIINNADDEKIDEVIKFVKDKSENGQLSSKQDIKEALNEIEEKYDTNISDDTKDEIANSISELENMGISTDNVISRAEELYNEYGVEMTDHMEELFVDVVKDAAGDAAQRAIDGTKESIKEALSKIFS